MGSASAELCSSSDEGLAVVLVDHGSKRAEANRMLEEFAELYRCCLECSGCALTRRAGNACASSFLASQVAGLPVVQ